ncbi:MFS transporter [Jannaschia sp. LMIT008]|uniref:MFS transporter n=1 Tax=Jannaschia maritima TaxID=3032585 RepID=UPI0028111F87|nr:MFS transporter [Jannaschia sp. LMIT008]
MTGWGTLVRLAFVNAAIGALTALPVNLFNRLMNVELGLPATLAGLFVALHYGVQLSRPVWGHRADAAGRRTPVIHAGLAVLSAGIVAAAWAMTLPLGAALAVWTLAYVAIGLGVGAAGTSFLALLAVATPNGRKGAAATIAWLTLIAGAIAASVGASVMLGDYDPARLTGIVATIAAAAMGVALLATWGVERRLPAAGPAPREVSDGLRAALAATWSDPTARRFTGFVFLSILAFYASELILEPFAGHVHSLAPDASTALSGAKDGAALLGMVSAGVLATLGVGTLRAWAVTGCAVSATGLIALAMQTPITPATLTLGLGNGLFVVGAVGSMMRLAARRAGAAGTRMGVFGAAQAVAAGLAGLIATATVDLLRLTLPDATAYGTVFVAEAVLFLAAAAMAAAILTRSDDPVAIPGE